MVPGDDRWSESGCWRTYLCDSLVGYYVCYIVLIKGYAIFFRVLKGNNQMYSSLSVGQNVQFVYFGSIIFNSNNSSRGGS